jgi:predicted membrane-bound spermidine synthase
MGSLWLFHWVAQFTAGASTAETGLCTFFLLLLPTLLMGSTLPLLVAHLVRRTANVGQSVGSLYAVNTLGSGVACLLAALFLMRLLGESESVRLAACLNSLVGIAAILISARNEPSAASTNRNANTDTTFTQNTIPFGIGMLLAGAAGFVALAYEIVWYRIYSFTSEGAASCFANLLAFYLFGIAYGAFQVHEICKQRPRHNLNLTLRTAATVVALGSIAAFLVGPAVSVAVSYCHLPYEVTFAFVFIASALTGAVFPILSHAAIGPTEQAGKRLSYLYLSNIVGSALGSFVIGFVILDHWSIGATSFLLLGLGFAVAVILAALARPLSSTPILAFVACLVLVLSNNLLFSHMYERLLSKSAYHRGTAFASLVENRSGVIAVDSKDTVYGGGAYDGHFNIDPIPDTNGIFRAYAIAGLHPDPKQVLIIGLSSGSWAQILANHPKVEDVTIVEINPGYLPLIRQHPEVANLLQNPKVHIYIDDGRRWLVSHPDRKFDFILMNTTFPWRANISNLVSTDFLQLIRRHLKQGGVEYYNTTGSGEVLLTGAKVFPFALRVSTFLAVSDSPIHFDRQALRANLTAYNINGQPVFDLSNPAHTNRLEQIVSIPFVNEQNIGNRFWRSLEDRSSLLARFKRLRPITDDNMGNEWR